MPKITLIHVIKKSLYPNQVQVSYIAPRILEAKVASLTYSHLSSFVSVIQDIKMMHKIVREREKELCSDVDTLIFRKIPNNNTD